jgi:hypothetical protein
MTKDQMFIMRKHFPESITLTVAAALLAGCGSSAYEAEFQASLTAQRHEAPFRELFKAYVAFPDTHLKLRMPKLFSTESGQSYALDQFTSDPLKLSRPLDAYRLQPDFLHLPGHVRTYERFVPSAINPRLSRQLPCYCYVAVTDTSAGSSENLQIEIRNKLVEAFGEFDEEPPAEDPARAGVKQAKKGTGYWEVLEVPTPDGSTLQARKIVAYGDQTFQYYVQNDEIKELFRPGVYVLYFYTTGQQHVLIGWRAPPDVAESVKMDELAEATLGTILLEEAAAAGE